MEKTVFDFNDYRTLMRAKMGWGSISHIAEAIGCQHSHLSRVVKGTHNLTSEQALDIASYWRLGETETDFFLLLVDWERAGTHELKRRLHTKIVALREDQTQMTRRFNASKSLEGDDMVYFTAWYWNAIHLLLAIPAYQTPRAIALKLELSQSFVAMVLSTLEKMQLVERYRDKWKLTSKSIHLSKESPFASVHHQVWRQRAVLDSQRPNSDAIHYTVVQTVSRKDVETIKALVYGLVNDYTAIAESSPSEELIALHCDFYRI